LRELLEMIARAFVDRPDEVSVVQIEEDDATVFELTVAPDDLGKVIGRQGRTAKAMRTMLGAAGMRTRRRLVLEILE